MLTYRREIDGLRALAVLPIIFFHAKFDTFSGGFLGVDVFFVISGYFITSIILAELEQGNFSIVNFYERRLRRILPALFLVMLVCMPFAWFWLLPSEMKSFSQSLIAVSVFVSNILFWHESGYFDPAAELKPLLHTLSLAIEIQYYLIFPLFLIFFWKQGKRWMLVALGLVFFASFALAELASYVKPAAAFYFLPMRCWEFFVGAFVGFYLTQPNRRDFSRVSGEIFSWLGIALIFYAVFSYSKETPFPGFYALVPTLGAALVIMFCTQNTSVGKIIGNRLFVGLGLISYSIYLWHQPIFVFAKHKSSTELSHNLFLILTVLTLVLAYISYKFVEVPFRSFSTVSKRKFFLLGFIFVILFVSFGYLGYKNNGFQQLMLDYKWSEKERFEVKAVLSATNYDMYREMAVSDCRLWGTNSKLIDPKKIESCQKKYGRALVILGDSHSMNLFNIISKSGAYPFIIGISKGGCRPHGDRPDCHYIDFQNFISHNKELIKLIIFHQSGSYFIKDIAGRVDSQAAFTGQFGGFEIENIIKVKSYLDELNTKNNLQVLWIGPFLEYRWNPNKKLFTSELKSANPVSIDLFKKLDQTIKNSISSSSSVKFTSFSDLFFEPIQSFEGDCFMFRDSDHYSKCGEWAISKRIKPLFLDRIIY